MQTLMFLFLFTLVFTVGGYLAKALLWREANPDAPRPEMFFDDEFWALDEIWAIWGVVFVTTLIVPVVGLMVLWNTFRWTGCVLWARVRGFPTPRPRWLQRVHSAHSTLCCCCWDSRGCDTPDLGAGDALELLGVDAPPLQPSADV